MTAKDITTAAMGSLASIILLMGMAFFAIPHRALFSATGIAILVVVASATTIWTFFHQARRRQRLSSGPQVAKTDRQRLMRAVFSTPAILGFGLVMGGFVTLLRFAH